VIAVTPDISTPVIIAPPPPLAPRARGRSGRLSYQQEAWLDVERSGMLGYRSRIRAHSSNNHLDLSVRSVDIKALERALAAVVRRHECLRTVFDDRGATPVPWAAPLVNVVDVSDDADPIAYAHRLAVDEFMRPFAYDRDVLCRATLFRLSAEESLFFFVVSHLVADGASLRVLRREITACYAYETGVGPRPPPVAVQYGDFVDWQRQWLDVDARADLLRYYQARIAGSQAATVPRMAAPGGLRTWRSASLPVRLSDSTAAAVHAVSLSARVVPVALLLAVYEIAIRVWCYSDDALIALPIAARRGAEMAELVGFITCHALIRSSVHGDPTFSELLARVKTSLNEAYANMGTPYGALVKIARERGDPDPQMKLCMSIESSPDDGVETGPFRSTSVPVEAHGVSRLTRWDLNLVIRQLSRTVECELRYCVDLLDEADARSYVRQLTALIDAATASPHLRISAIARAARDAAAAA